MVEIAGAIRVTRRYATYPTDAEWDFIANHDCLLLVDGLIGGPINAGPYYATDLHPAPIYWVQDKQHWVQCAVAKRDSNANSIDGALIRFTGPVEGTSTTRLQHIGSCADRDVIYVACTSPHLLEIAGYVDLGTSVSTRPTNAAAWNLLVGRRCEQIGASYLGRPYRADEGFTSAFIPADRWAVGVRVDECFVARRDSSGNALAVTGSLKNG
ncbi:MAG: Septum formation [Actinomycetota bacterium]|nr:Septum formation [Actinomycetota bacterium]